MPIVTSKPVTPGQRYLERNQKDISKKRPERRLTSSKHRKKGRNAYGRITSRRRGGGHKKLYRAIDFEREKLNIPAKVEALEYDPNRTALIALLCYQDGEKRYVLAPRGLKVGDVVQNVTEADEFKIGWSMPLGIIPPSTRIHAIELNPGRGAKLVRSAGNAAQLISVEKGKATVKMPSGEVRLLNAKCRATIGMVGNQDRLKESMGKAGRNRWKGRRPRVRGVAMNPVDHPMGGGEGRTSGGGHPVSPWGQLSKSFPTRSKTKRSNKDILVRRNGRKVKKG